MKIVIAGAGAVGFHLANLLSKEELDITLIDLDRDVLMHAGRHVDVLTVQGDATSLSILEQADVKRAQLFISVTTSEKTNLLSTILAKQLGAKNTIARISNPEHLKPDNRARFHDLGVDVLISPEKFAAQEIEALLRTASFTDLFEFEDGKISVVGFNIDAEGPLVGQTFESIDNLTKDFEFLGIALVRGLETIIPNGQTILQPGDHLYISTRSKMLEKAMRFVGKKTKPIRSIMIIGDTALALRAAQQLEKTYNVKIVVENEERGKMFYELLERSLVINANPSDIDALKEEGLEEMDAFIALTPNSETNIIASLMAEQYNICKSIALVENVNYTHISQNIGIDTIINKKLIAANNIFKYVRKGKVEAVAKLHGVDGEIIEFTVHKNNRVLAHPIKELHFPAKSIIAGVVRKGKSFIPNGDTFFEIEDKVIILALPDAIKQIEEIFK